MADEKLCNSWLGGSHFSRYCSHFSQYCNAVASITKVTHHCLYVSLAWHCRHSPQLPLLQPRHRITGFTTTPLDHYHYSLHHHSPHTSLSSQHNTKTHTYSVTASFLTTVTTDIPAQPTNTPHKPPTAHYSPPPARHLPTVDIGPTSQLCTDAATLQQVFNYLSWRRKWRTFVPTDSMGGREEG